MKRHASRIGAAALVASAAWMFGAAPAGAIITGPCQATVKGIDVRPLSVSDPDAAIEVKHDETISWTVDAPAAAASRELVLSYAGVDVVIDRDTSTGTNGGSRGGSANIADYAWMGAGLYQVAGVAHLSNGGTCSGAVLIKVDGNPLGTLAGITAAILTVLGTLGVIVAAIRQGGGRLVQDIVDFIALSGAADPLVAGGGPAGPPPTATEPTPPPPAPPANPPPDPPATDPGTGTKPPRRSGGAPVADGTSPPPLPGMATVAAAGTTAQALTDANKQLKGEIDKLPVSDAEKKKLKESLGLDKIQDKLDTVTSTVDTVQHFEGMGTETVDTMNQWGVNSNGINGLLWLRTMLEASGRLGQKATDELVVPVVAPIAKAAGQAGVKVDAEEVAHTLLPVQAVAEEGSKALLTASKNVLGGDNVLNQLHQDPVVDEEWRNIRSFN